jgi:hypothetical protein
MKATTPTTQTWKMSIALQHIQRQRCINNSKPDWFVVGPGMAHDIMDVHQGQCHNPKGVPTPIQEESDGTLNISDIDVWMWLKILEPKSQPINLSMQPPLISLFSEPGQWRDLINPWECLVPQTLSGH